MKKGRILLVVFIALIFAGCVSTKEYKAKIDEIDNIKKYVSTLEEKLKAKEAEKASLEAELSRLRQEQDALAKSKEEQLKAKDKEIADLKGQIAALSQEKNKALEEKEKAIAELKKTYNKLVSELNEEIKKGEVAVTQLRDKLSLSMVEKILFDSGSADIKIEGKKVLERVAEILKKVSDKQIRIEGHTDNIPIGPRIAKKFPSNWDLSNARATNVVRYLQEKGIDPKLLSPVGYAEYRPVSPNDSDVGRAKNRRIEIVLVPLDTDKPNP